MSNKRKAQAGKTLVAAGFTPEQVAAHVAATGLPVAPEDDPSSAVAFAFVHQTQVEYSFMHSFVGLLGYDMEHHGRIWRGGIIAERGTTGDLPGDRNRGVTDFLKDGKAGWLLWCDTDMGFEPDAVDRLLAVADPVERPVMGGMCFAQREDTPDGVGGWRSTAWPVLMDWNVVDGRGGFQIRWDYPRDAVTRCHGVGSAFVLVHRSAFERVKAVYSEASGDPGWAKWYSRIINPTTGELIGEDLSFCMRLMGAEIPVHVHTGVETTHRKNVWLQSQDYWRQRALAPAPERVPQLPREKWLAPRFAIVPTHNRPMRLKALVESLAQQCDHVVILDNASDPAVDVEPLLEAAGAAGSGDDFAITLIRDEEQPPNLSRFWNVMFDAAAGLAKERGFEAWDVAVFNDDAVVPAGWFDVCSTVLRGHEKAAVAHTGTAPVHRHELVEAYPYPREKRMCPWAFVVKGELGIRSDESMRWWYFDDDLCRAAIDAGGVLAVPGPLVINAQAVQSTQQNPALALQAEKDRVTFEAKWAGQL